MTEIPELLKLLALGGTAGVLSGMFGIGGGLVIVPALVLIFGFDIKTAIGTSLFVILLPTGLLGVLEYYKNGQTEDSCRTLDRAGRIHRGLFRSEALRRDLGDDDEAMLRVVSVGGRCLFPAVAPAREQARPAARRAHCRAGRSRCAVTDSHVQSQPVH